MRVRISDIEVRGGHFLCWSVKWLPNVCVKIGAHLGWYPNHHHAYPSSAYQTYLSPDGPSAYVRRDQIHVLRHVSHCSCRPYLRRTTYGLDGLGGDFERHQIRVLRWQACLSCLHPPHMPPQRCPLEQGLRPRSRFRCVSAVARGFIAHFLSGFDADSCKSVAVQFSERCCVDCGCIGAVCECFCSGICRGDGVSEFGGRKTLKVDNADAVDFRE